MYFLVSKTHYSKNKESDIKSSDIKNFKLYLSYKQKFWQQLSASTF